MPYNLSLSKLLIWLCCLFLTACSSDINNPFGLDKNQIFYVLDTGSERNYKVNATLSELDGRYKLSIKGSNNSDGLIITIKGIRNKAAQLLDFNKEVNVIVNEKIDKELNIYVSSGCKDNPGTFEIVNWDKDNKTITGTFSGPVCTRGIFSHLPNTEIREGAFYKLKYYDK